MGGGWCDGVCVETSSEEKITHDFVNPAMRKELEMTSVNISTTANAEQPSL